MVGQISFDSIYIEIPRLGKLIETERKIDITQSHGYGAFVGNATL
jgi:hypothetical protein